MLSMDMYYLITFSPAAKQGALYEGDGNARAGTNSSFLRRRMRKALRTLICGGRESQGCKRQCFKSEPTFTQQLCNIGDCKVLKLRLSAPVARPRRELWESL
jgi:hypothetical protein